MRSVVVWYLFFVRFVSSGIQIYQVPTLHNKQKQALADRDERTQLLMVLACQCLLPREPLNNTSIPGIYHQGSGALLQRDGLRADFVELEIN